MAITNCLILNYRDSFQTSVDTFPVGMVNGNHENFNYIITIYIIII